MKSLRIIMAGSLIFGQVGFPLSDVFAQTKKSNAQFLQELQAPIEESGPILKKPTKRAKRIPRQRTPGTSLNSMGSNKMKEAPMYETAESASPLDKKIGPIRLKRAPLSTFLDVISAQSKVNFIISEGIEAKKISGKPLVVHVHATEFDMTGGNGVNQHVYDLERWGMHEADLIIAVSIYTKNIIVKH